MYQRVHLPEAADRRSVAWPGGRFDAGRRPFTPRVEGVTRAADHLLLVTLRGGARRLEVRSDCGHRYDGPERAGAVSLAPAENARRIALSDVAAEWASVSLAPGLIEGGARRTLRPFSNADDPFAAAIVAELDRAQRGDGGLDPAYGETLTLALARYLGRRYGGASPAPAAPLAPWRLGRVKAFVDAHLGRPIAIAELAAVAGLSAGHFHRAFRETTGVTPLRYMTERRVERAAARLGEGGVSVIEAAAEVGFASPSHFARAFRRMTGRPPSALTRG